MIDLWDCVCLCIASLLYAFYLGLRAGIWAERVTSEKEKRELMKLLTSHFRCDLCGHYRDRGVTETQATSPRQTTKVCSVCVTEAAKLLFDVQPEAVQADNTNPNDKDTTP